MWTIAIYAWKCGTGKPERLWSAERVHFDANNGIEWWNNNSKSYIDEFFDYDIDIKNKAIIIYENEIPEHIKKKSVDEEISW